MAADFTAAFLRLSDAHQRKSAVELRRCQKQRWKGRATAVAAHLTMPVINSMYGRHIEAMITTICSPLQVNVKLHTMLLVSLLCHLKRWQWHHAGCWAVFNSKCVAAALLTEVESVGVQVYLDTAQQPGFDGPYLIELTIMLLLSKVFPSLATSPAYRRYFHDYRAADLARARQLSEDPYMLIKFKASSGFRCRSHKLLHDYRGADLALLASCQEMTDRAFSSRRHLGADTELAFTQAVSTSQDLSRTLSCDCQVIRYISKSAIHFECGSWVVSQQAWRQLSHAFVPSRA